NNWVTGETHDTNRRLFTRQGYTAEELPRSLKEVFARIHPEDLDRSLKIISQYFAGEIPVYYSEMRIQAKDGTWCWIASAGKVLARDENGNLTRFVGMSYDIHARKLAEQEREEAIQKLLTALAEIKTLRGIVPICASCKKVRDDQGYWNQVEAYVSKHSEIQFTHGLCPECLKALYPDFTDKPPR
ncbi:MAG: PAS domain-containing protein, partial [Candidatus Riflebacteria bacterium]|nr:PAS domain-containing protein [Candidatus Riflebacteria bacterium]